MLRELALSSVWVTQVTSHQLRSQKETEKQAAAEEAKKRELAAKREVLLFPVFSLLTCLLWLCSVNVLPAVCQSLHDVETAVYRLRQCSVRYTHALMFLFEEMFILDKHLPLCTLQLCMAAYSASLMPCCA